MSKIKRYNKITIPLFELEDNGIVKPNLLFHRRSDKVHSRCIEYPFAASKWKPTYKRILDVGVIYSSPFWMKWLESLPCDVYAVDYDKPHLNQFTKIKFKQSDVRNLSYENNFFDIIFAISVIEHIGLENPQVLRRKKPQIEVNGDISAVKELARVLKKRGKLVMTLPFGIKEGLVLRNQAKNYTRKSIKKFEKLLQLDEMEYYEYQRQPFSLPNNKIKRFLYQTRDFIAEKMKLEKAGLATWKKTPLQKASASQRHHIDGVVCGVWSKL